MEIQLEKILLPNSLVSKVLIKFKVDSSLKHQFKDRMKQRQITLIKLPMMINTISLMKHNSTFCRDKLQQYSALMHKIGYRDLKMSSNKKTWEIIIKWRLNKMMKTIKIINKNLWK